MLVLGAVAAVALMAVGAFATWYVMQIIEIGGNSVSTGLATEAHLAVSPTSAIWPPVADIQPGDGSYGMLTVTNDVPGDPDARFAVTTAHTDQILADEIRAVVWDLTLSSCVCTQGLWPSGAAKTANEAWGGACGWPGNPYPVNVYDGTLGSLAIGDPAMGAQSGDINILSGGTSRLCFSVMLPSDAPVTVGGLSDVTTVVITGDPTP